MNKCALGLTLAALSITAAACSPPSSASDATANANSAAPVTAPSEPASPPEAAEDRVLGLEGLGALKIGEAVPAGSAWSTPGGQASEGCSAVRSAAYPGVYGLVEGGKVRRITAGPGSDVKLAEGIGVGASEADVQKWFAGFHSEPHKYEAAPAKYLTAPNAAGGSSALRFEIGGDGKVKMIHIGLMPQLAYVEGCG